MNTVSNGITSGITSKLFLLSMTLVSAVIALGVSKVYFG